MGVVGSKLQRAARRFNVESRAEKVLSQEKPKAAPRHPTEEKHLLQISQDEQTKEELLKKNIKLDDYLKDVYVTSYDPPPIKNPKFAKPSQRDRLPQFRGAVEETQMGFIESEVVPEGKISLRQAMRILSDYQGDPVKNNASAVSEKYKLPLPAVDNMLSYFASLNIRIKTHQESIHDAKLSPPSKPTVVEVEEGVVKKELK